MPLLSGVACVLSMALAGIASSAWAESANSIQTQSVDTSPAETSPTETKSAETLLQELGPALAKTSYRGVFVYSRGDQVNAMQVTHRYRNNQVEERLVMQDGHMGEIVRLGQRLFCALPSGRSLRLDAVIPTGSFADVFSGQWEPIGRWYSAERIADDRVAGHGAAVVAVDPYDEHRYRYRLWLEKKTGLLVKSQVLARDDAILERFQFTMLTLTTDFQDSEFEMQSTIPAKELKLRDKPATPDEEPMTGWDVEWRPSGFMPAAAPRARRGQAVAYSDGLASFSVFVRPLDNMDMPAGVSRIGATTVFMRKLEVDNNLRLVTVVGEIPPETAMKIAKSVRFNESQSVEQLDSLQSEF